MGKKNAFLLCQGISVIGYILLWFLFVPGKPWLYIIALPLFSFGIGSLFTIMMSMTADIIDIDELKSGLRREGIFGAIYWWMVKVGFAIAGALSGVIIAIVGFDPDLSTIEQQPAVDGLHAFFCFFPMAGTIIAMLVMKDYDVTEERANEIREKLSKRKGVKKFPYEAGKLISLVGNEIDLRSLNGAIDLSKKPYDEIKALFKSRLNGGLHGLCFSPYIEGQESDDQLTSGQIRQRMKIIAPYAQWIRTFSCTSGNELIPSIAREYNKKTLVGAWISDDKERNEEEINQLIKLAQAGLVDIAAVGNEALLREEVNESELVGYINKVKSAVDNVPVGYVDTYYEFYQNPGLVEVCDVILANFYPFWEGGKLDYSPSYLDRMLEFTKDIAKGKKVIVAETGWPSEGNSILEAEPSPVNAAKYFIQVQNWAEKNDIEVFYFSSFDESWKVRIEGPVGARWGLWNKDEELKY